MNLEKLFQLCRFSKRYRGYYMFRDCLHIILEDEEALQYMTGIYMDVAKKYHTLWKGVERNIRTMLDYSWRTGGKEQFELLTGTALNGRLTTGETLELLTDYVKEHPEITWEID